MKHSILLYSLFLAYLFPYSAQCQKYFQSGEVIIEGVIDAIPKGASDLMALRFGDWVLVEREISFIQVYLYRLKQRTFMVHQVILFFLA